MPYGRDDAVRSPFVVLTMTTSASVGGFALPILTKSISNKPKNGSPPLGRSNRGTAIVRVVASPNFFPLAQIFKSSIIGGKKGPSVQGLTRDDASAGGKSPTITSFHLAAADLNRIC